MNNHAPWLRPGLLLIGAMVLGGPTRAVPAQQDLDAPQPSRARATEALQRGRLSAACAELERIVAGDPEDGVAWFQLASALHASGESRGARKAYERATSTPAVAEQAHYNAACLLAVAGELAQAWEHLERAAAMGARVPSRLVAEDEDLAVFRERDDFADLVARFAVAPRVDPSAVTAFLEPDVEVLWEFRSDTGLERFGWQSEAVGDVDGDGVADILTGAPRSAEGADRGGKAWLLSGRDGRVVRTHVGRMPGGQLGFRCKALGDLDLDGVDDYLLSAPGGNSLDGSVPPHDAGLPHAGEVFVHSGASGDVLLHLQGAGPTDRLGFDAAAVADLDGDGLPEIAVGSPGHDGAHADVGRVTLHAGSDGRILREHRGRGPLDRLGSAVGALGDLDGDGVADYVLGAPGAGATAAGQAYVHSGAGGERLFVLDPQRDEPTARALEFGRFFASSAGDVDGDGVDDLYLADSFDQTHALASGRLYLYSGADGSLIYSVAGRETNAWYGIGRGLHTDLDGDGHDDLVVASLASAVGAPGGGRLDLLSGADGQRLRSFTGTLPGLCLGYDVHPVGDVDGDGGVDVFVTGSWSSWHPELRGRGVLIRGPRAILR